MIKNKLQPKWERDKSGNNFTYIGFHFHIGIIRTRCWKSTILTTKLLPLHDYPTTNFNLSVTYMLFILFWCELMKSVNYFEAYFKKSVNETRLKTYGLVIKVCTYHLSCIIRIHIALAYFCSLFFLSLISFPFILLFRLGIYHVSLNYEVMIIWIIPLR